MKRTALFAGMIAALVFLSAAASADWYENFDSYAPGSQIVGQGGWEEWGTGAGALVSNLYSISPTNSVEVVGATDLVHQYSGYTTGKWLYTAWIYIPNDFSGLTYFIMLNTYNTGGPYDWSVQVGFDSTDGKIHADCGSGNQIAYLDFVTGEWACIQVFIDLDVDWVQIYYNGHLLDDPQLADDPDLGGGYQWTGGVFGGGTGALNIGAVDLFANAATPVFYDDMSLTPAYPWVDAKCNGGDSMVVVPVGTNAKIDFSLVAGIGTGVSLEVWIVLQSPYGLLSYNGTGPYLGWNMGATSVFYNGPLRNISGTVLDYPLPAGSYTAHIAIDPRVNGVPDPAYLYALDSVDFVVQ